MRLLYFVAMATCCGACPLWFRHNNKSDKCECGDDLEGLVHCNQQTKEVSVLFCYCMTYSDTMDTTVVGPCLQMCTRRHTPKCQSLNQITTDNKSYVNTEMCGEYNRDGLLCGKCKEGYAYPVYSYTLKCINCTGNTFTANLAKYFAVAFLPLTVVYLLVVIFKISVTSGNMVGYILTCQILTMPTLLRAMTHGDENHFILSWFTMWNLDSLRLAYPPFCLHQNMTILHVLALDYLVGVYPLFLIFLTYIAVTLHDRYSIVVKIWRPAYRVFMCIRREWNIRGSLIQAFATFLTLSYVKMLNISFDLLTPVHLKTKEGKTLNKAHLFINGEIVFFGREHLPYGILAIVMLVFFSVLPLLLLLLYPCNCFQKCLKTCKLKSHGLHTLMDAFQACYHHHPTDCRYFAGIYILVRIVFLSITFLVQDPTSFAIFGFSFISLTVLVIHFEPYKVRYHNKIDAIFFLMYAALSFLSGLYVYLVPAEPHIPVTPILVSIISPMSLVVIFYGVVIILHKLMPKMLFNLVKKWWEKLSSKKEGKKNYAEENTLPYRLEIATSYPDIKNRFLSSTN